jgi:AdoMet-dependent heme synthase
MGSATPVMDRLIARTVARHVPLNVHFDLTYRCNERCIHCYLDHEDHGELSTAEVIGILEQLAGAGTLFLAFSGGEIFLRKDLFEILGNARELGFDVSLKTNAILIDESRARMLRELGVRRIQISIYSSEAAIHDAITKVKGSLCRSLAAISLLKSQGLQVKIACPLMKQNLSSYQGFVHLAEELGVPYVIDMTITPKLDGNKGVLSLRSSGTELLPILQNLSCADSRPASDEYSNPQQNLGSVTSSGIDSAAYADLPCSAGHNSCYISPYGDVFPCVQMPLPTGNLRRQRFGEIWRNSPEMNRVRAVRESRLRVCSTCELRQHCERCPGLALMEGGDLEGPYERACELAEIKAQQAGVANPVSAWHRSARYQHSGSLAPAADLVQLATP